MFKVTVRRGEEYDEYYYGDKYELTKGYYRLLVDGTKLEDIRTEEDV